MHRALNFLLMFQCSMTGGLSWKSASVLSIWNLFWFICFCINKSGFCRKSKKDEYSQSGVLSLLKEVRRRKVDSDSIPRYCALHVFTKAKLVRNVSIWFADPVKELSRESRNSELVQLARRRYPPAVTVRRGPERSVSAQRWNKQSSQKTDRIFQNSQN